MRQKDHGFIMITVLLALVLLIFIGTTLMLKSTSNLQQTGNSQGQAQARGAAEAGQADMFYFVANAGLIVINTTLKPFADAFAASQGNAATTPIIPPGSYSSILANIKANMPDISRPATASDPTSSTSSITLRTMRTDINAYSTNTGSTGSNQVQPYYIDYSISSNGSLGENRRTVVTEGTLKVLLGRAPLNMYILLADDGGSGSNGTSGWLDGTSSYDGPVQVNRNLALSGTPTFSAGLKYAGSSIFMNTSCNAISFISVTGQQSSGCTVPNTNGNGIQYNADYVPLPTNAASQARAALGLDPTNLTQPTNAEICGALLPLPASNCTTAPNGVYVPSLNGKPSGGIYIQGSGQVSLSVNAGKQVYTLTNSNNKITTVTVDYAAKTTVVIPPTGPTLSYSGLPNGQVYVNGSLTSLSGPTRTNTIPNPAPSTSVPTQIPPAIASGSQLNIAAASTVTITGDITYQDDPRTVANSQNVLGVIAGNGNVNIGTAAPNDIYLQGAFLTGKAGSGLGVDGYASAGRKGSIHLLGSLAEATDQVRGNIDPRTNTVVNGYADDLHFDSRFTNGAVSPPFFPASSKFTVQASFPLQRTWTDQ